jgi:hypothetical protein
MNMVNEGVLPPDEIDDRDERHEEREIAQKSETLAEIVREKRRMAAEIRANLSTVPVRREGQLLDAEELDSEADRIEAAWKREKAEIEANALSVGGVVEAARHKPGNAANMREAIEKVLEIANREWDAHRETSAMWEVHDICTMALAKPPRNCDLVKSFDEAEERFASFCVNQPSCTSCPLQDVPTCRARWLLAVSNQTKGEKK